MSKYPSAYGHTPSYRSVGSMPSAVYPSALGARDSDLSFRTSGLGSGLSASIDREFSAMKSSMDADSLLSRSSLLPSSSLTAPSGSSTAYKSSSYSSSEVRSSNDGGIPHRTSNSESTYKSTATGASGIPHTSYSHSASSFDSDRPLGGRSSHFSYNI